MVASLRKPFPPQTPGERSRGTHDHRATIVHQGDRFSHDDADRMSRRAEMGPAASRIIIDLTSASEADTSAFARLVLLRRSLLRSGRDLAITGLRDQARGLFEVNRLETVLPRED